MIPFLFSVMSAAWAGDDGVVMVLNARNPTQNLSAAEVKAIYLGQTSFWHGVVPMKVVGRPPTSAAATAMFDDVLGVSAQKYQEIWTAKQLAGQGIAPAAEADPAKVMELVAKNPGAIAYVLASEAWAQPPEGIRYIELEAP